LIWLRFWQVGMLVLCHFDDLSLVCFSHLRSRLTDQGESYHFGGYADIRVLGNAFLLFTAAWVLTVSARALK